MDLSSTIREIAEAGFKLNSEEDDFFIDVIPSKNHTILFQEDLTSENIINFVEFPWNSDDHWEKVTKSLEKLKSRIINHKDSLLIEYAISKYNKVKQNYKNIETLFQDVPAEKSNFWLETVVPKIVDLVLESKKILQKQIPILSSKSNHSISLTKKQCACILANAFFSTFENRFGKINPPSMPFFNLNLWFDYSKSSHNSVKIEKLKCMMVYFERITSSTEPVGVLTFSRYNLDNPDKNTIKNCTKKIRKTIFLSKGKIEDCGGAVQLDFANKYIGGGVLNSGCVQEEIRFVICPELLVSLLFMERMSEHECILIRGAERFSDYTGYSSSFRLKNEFIDTTKKDKYERIMTDVLAIDATNYRVKKDQFCEKYFWREIFKSYAGFFANWKEPKGQLPCLATGNWGCGVFNGDFHLKYLIQLISACVADRDLVYFTFGDQKLLNELSKMNQILLAKSVDVKTLVEFLLKFFDIRQNLNVSVNDFLTSILNSDVNSDK